VNRLIGTTLGAIVGYLFFAVLGGTALLALFMVTLFLLVATQTVHYAVFVFFVTLNVVLSGALGGSAGDQLSIDRLVATIIGIGIALGAVAVLTRFWKPDRPAASTPSAGGGASSV
jgi:uncharacterized membrane protein YccC